MSRHVCKVHGTVICQR